MRDELIEIHRRIEAELDRVAGGDPDALQRALELCRDLYPREQEFLAALHPEAARKIARQHDEALELASHVGGVDTEYLVRRFVAIVQHTIIEVERDLFPLG